MRHAAHQRKENPIMANLIGINRIALLPGVTEEDFEQFMTEEVFPAARALSRGVRSDAHYLLKDYGGNGEDKYLWLMVLEHFGTEHSVPDAIPEVFEEIYSEVREKLQPFGIRTSFSMSSELSRVGPPLL
jgi:hypothetical protein